jgi:nucleoside-diphosphate-sugar epimerase
LFQGSAGRAYNVGNPAQMTIREVAEITSTALGLTAPVLVAKDPIRGQATSRYIPNVDRARTELGLESHIDLGSSLKKTSLWCKYNDD